MAIFHIHKLSRTSENVSNMREDKFLLLDYDSIQQERLALYTTVHPGSAPYLAAWLRSVNDQIDKKFDIWLGVDQLSPADVMAAMGGDPQATWAPAQPGMTPTEIRQQAIIRMIDHYPAIVFVDSDDQLEPERVARARQALTRWDVSGCAMRLIDQAERDLNVVFQWPKPFDQQWDRLVRANAFGLGNTAYRSTVLRRCLPIPPACVMEDWFLITRAWTQGVRLGFDYECTMAYRQHGANMTAILPPFTEEQILRTAREVLQHYAFVLTAIPELRFSHRHAIQQARYEVEAFLRVMGERPDCLQRYLQALNQLPPTHLWFEIVAHPELERLWRV